MEKTDHELLLCIDQGQKELKIQFTNHLSWHRSMSIALVSLVGTLMIALIIALLV